MWNDNYFALNYWHTQYWVDTVTSPAQGKFIFRQIAYDKIREVIVALELLIKH